ncbi:MAG: hypothetical protein A2359_01875, partial [Candidatus Moranbacteria bacterium RIFOXYB1_FULL_43_19]
ATIRKKFNQINSGCLNFNRIPRSLLRLGNSFLIELASLLHDLDDYKLREGGETDEPKRAKEWLEKQKVSQEIIYNILGIVETMSFKGAKVDSTMKTKEGMIVQDADRLDAIGAIGIGRTFAFGGAKGREMYNPDIKPEMHSSFEQYKSSQSSTINHFYEKLLLLKDLMNTKTGQVMAEERHKYMEEFLGRFFKEWEGKL